MLTNFIRNMVQMGGTSTFEKARLSATFKGDYDQPTESDIQAILLTLGNKDPETRPQIGFTKIVEKMEKSDSKVHWNYIVKNLIILDRCIEYNYFVQDIASMEVNYVKNYSETNAEFKRNNVDGFIQKYYNYIKTKANLYSKRNSSFNIPKEEKKIYFNQQSIEQIFEELIQSQKLHDVILDLGSSDRNGLLKFKVNQYVFMLLMTTLINLYSTQYISILALLGKMLNMDINSIKKLRDLYNQFLKNNEKLIAFINSHRNLKGYADVNIYEIGRVDPRIIMSIEEYMRIVEKPTNNVGSPEEVILEQGWIDDVLKVDEGYDIRQSIHEFEKENKSQMINRQSIIQQTLDSKLTDQPMEFKILQYSKNHKDQFAQIAPFDENVYWAFHNNFSLEYIPIEIQFRQQLSSNQNLRYDSLSPRQSKYQLDIQKDDLIIFNSLVQLDEQIFLQFENFYCFDIQYWDRKDSLQLENIESILKDTPKIHNLDQINEVSQRLEHDEHQTINYQNLHSELQNLLHDDELQLLNSIYIKSIPLHNLEQFDNKNLTLEQINGDEQILDKEIVDKKPIASQLQQEANEDIDLDAFEELEEKQEPTPINAIQQIIIPDQYDPVQNQDEDIDLDQFGDIDQNPDPQINQKQTVEINVDQQDPSPPNIQTDQNSNEDIDLDAFGELEGEQDKHIDQNTEFHQEQVQEVININQQNDQKKQVDDIDLDQFGDLENNSESQQEINQNFERQEDEIKPNSPQLEQDANDDIDLDAFGELEDHEMDNNNIKQDVKEQRIVMISDQGVNKEEEIDLEQFENFDSISEPHLEQGDKKAELDSEGFQNKNQQLTDLAQSHNKGNDEIDLDAFGELEDEDPHTFDRKTDQHDEATGVKIDLQKIIIDNQDNEIDLDQFGDLDQVGQYIQNEKAEINSQEFKIEKDEIKQTFTQSHQEENNEIDLDAFGELEDNDENNEQHNEKPQEIVISDQENKSEHQEDELDLDQFGDLEDNNESLKEQQNKQVQNNLEVGSENKKVENQTDLPQFQIKSHNEIDLDAFGELEDVQDHSNASFQQHNQKALEDLNYVEQNHLENQEVAMDLDQFGDLEQNTDSQKNIKNIELEKQQEGNVEELNKEKDEMKSNFAHSNQEANDEIDLDAFGELDEEHDPEQHTQKSQEVVMLDQFKNQEDDIDFEQFGDFDQNAEPNLVQDHKPRDIDINECENKNGQVRQEVSAQFKEANDEIDLDAFGDLEENDHTIDNNSKQFDENRAGILNKNNKVGNQVGEIDLDQFGDFDDLEDA